MSSDEARRLYQSLILEHGRAPHNYHKLEDATHTLEGNNPLCGDRYVLQLRIQDDHIEDAAFEGHGCAISMASASMMTDLIKSLSCEQAQTLFAQFQRITQGEPVLSESLPEELKAFSGLAEYPARIKCANLIWYTLQATLTKQNEPVSTE